MKQQTTSMRSDAIDIFQAGLMAVAPVAAIKAVCSLEGEVLTIDNRKYDLGHYDDIVVIGAGKAGATMALAVEDILGPRISKGLVVVKYEHIEELQTIELVEAGHPVPDENGINAAARIMQMAEEATERTLLICLISGGGSALLPQPVGGVTLADKQETTKALLACGATIHEINSIRKHLSVIKGGGLARAAYPATVTTLILSDVVGDDLDTIASGPCVPDSRTFEDCFAVLHKYDIVEQIPAAVLDWLRAGVEGRAAETPKAGEPCFEKTSNVIVASNFNGLMYARQKAEALGYKTLVLSSMIEGETREVAANHVAIAKEVVKNGYPVAAPACILTGGETTVTIKGRGKGGRNQEFALASAIKLDGMENVVVLCAGTDGNDGPTDAAGGVVDGTTLARAAQAGLDARRYLDDNDAYPFLEKVDDLLKTGPTNTNVMDIRVVLIGTPE